MAITGISSYDGKQIIAAGAQSAIKAYQDSNGDVITSKYQTTANMSNYQTTADMGDYATTADLTGYLTTADSANFYSVDNPSGFISEVPESALSSFIPYSASGVELPNSKFEIDTSGQAFKIVSAIEKIKHPVGYKWGGIWLSLGGSAEYPAGKYEIRVPTSAKIVTFSEQSQFSALMLPVTNGVAEWDLTEDFTAGNSDIIAAYPNEEATGAQTNLTSGNASVWLLTDTFVNKEYALKDDIKSAVSSKVDRNTLVNVCVPMSGIIDNSRSAKLSNDQLSFTSKYNNASSYVGYSNHSIDYHERSANVLGYASQFWLSQTGLYLRQSSAYGSAYSGYVNLNPKYLELESVYGKAHIWLNGSDLLHIYTSGNNESPSFIKFDKGYGPSYSAANTGIGQFFVQPSADVNVQRYNPVWIVKNGSGDGFSIGASEAKGFDKDGNTIWSTKQSKASQLINGATDSKPAILLVDPPTTTSYSASWSASPYLSADNRSFTVSYGGTGPTAIIKGDGITFSYTSNTARYGQGNAAGAVNIGTENSASWNISDDFTINKAGVTYSLRNSIQISDIDGDSETSAISAIAGSALTCELPADLVYTATLSATSGLLNDDIQTVSAAIPVLSSLNTEGITDIQLVNELPVDPVSTVLYLIPEA